MNGMNDVDEISPCPTSSFRRALRGLVSDRGEIASTKIGQLRCRNAYARNNSVSEFQSIMKTPTTLFITIFVLF
jgi:hypothetical protein